MKTLAIFFCAFILPLSVFAQSRSNESIKTELRSLGQDAIEVEYDASSNMTKIKAVAENFSRGDEHSAGVKAMNFAAGLIYPGSELKPENANSFIFAFWVLSSRPQFGEAHSLTIHLSDKSIDLGVARYVARARDNMEYLNFVLTREQLREIAENDTVKCVLGGKELTFTKRQLKLLADLYIATEPK